VREHARGRRRARRWPSRRSRGSTGHSTLGANVPRELTLRRQAGRQAGAGAAGASPQPECAAVARDRRSVGARSTLTSGAGSALSRGGQSESGGVRLTSHVERSRRACCTVSAGSPRCNARRAPADGCVCGVGGVDDVRARPVARHTYRLMAVTTFYRDETGLAELRAHRRPRRLRRCPDRCARRGDLPRADGWGFRREKHRAIASEPHTGRALAGWTSSCAISGLARSRFGMKL
jgi:hypothetical protein